MLAKTFQKRNNAQSGSNIYIKCTCEKIFSHMYIFPRNQETKAAKNVHVRNFFLTCKCFQEIRNQTLGKIYILENFSHLYIYSTNHEKKN